MATGMPESAQCMAGPCAGRLQAAGRSCAMWSGHLMRRHCGCHVCDTCVCGTPEGVYSLGHTDQIRGSFVDLCAICTQVLACVVASIRYDQPAGGVEAKFRLKCGVYTEDQPNAYTGAARLQWRALAQGSRVHLAISLPATNWTAIMLQERARLRRVSCLCRVVGAHCTGLGAHTFPHAQLVAEVHVLRSHTDLQS